MQHATKDGRTDHPSSSKTFRRLREEEEIKRQAVRDANLAFDETQKKVVNQQQKTNKNR